MDNPTLFDLIRDWIMNDQILEQHFKVVKNTWSHRSSPTREAGTIESKCNRLGTTPAYIYEIHCMGASRWWPKYGEGEIFWKERLYAADPQFFEKLKVEILRSHDCNPSKANCGIQLIKSNSEAAVPEQ